MLCKKTVKNQITLPKKIVDKFAGVDYFDAVAEKDRLILIPVKISPLKRAGLSQVRKKISLLGISEQDIEEAIRWARKR